MKLGEILFFSLIGPIILLAITSQRETYADTVGTQASKDSGEEVPKQQEETG